jgi:hypothetical protein
MEEARLERRLKREIELIGGVCVKFIPYNIAGTPDRLLFLPGGKLYLVELKAKRGKLSAIQKARRKQYERLNFNVRVVYDDEGLKGLLEEIKLEMETLRLSD